ncbi:glycerophosphoryl diester phosphodiesterase [Mucilaginibacter galii]|uniref:Glycerophosphoryl diester phosphodiesterase n=2 Tax=Mucilaginibacter galii TaxID=2005073 RepID=A0A917JDS7_9SPHI|nr:glycerophosphoryl diester phosphodiesterase [Mucilaginibacter galii]
MPKQGLCAHRGGFESTPENTVPGFEEAIKYGAQMIEFDIQFTKDSALVIMHDGTVDRTTNGRGAVADMTLNEIRKLDAGIKKGSKFASTKVPTLDETLALMPKNVWLNCHLKGGSKLGAAVALVIQKTNRMHQAFLTCEEDAAQGARAACPAILICNADSRYRANVPQYVAATIKNKANFIQLLVLKPGEDRTEQIALLKKNNIRINYFEAQKPEMLEDLFKSGVDFILTNDLPHFVTEAKRLGIAPVQPIY